MSSIVVTFHKKYCAAVPILGWRIVKESCPVRVTSGYKGHQLDHFISACEGDTSSPASSLNFKFCCGFDEVVLGVLSRHVSKGLTERLSH